MGNLARLNVSWSPAGNVTGAPRMSSHLPQQTSQAESITRIQSVCAYDMYRSVDGVRSHGADLMHDITSGQGRTGGQRSTSRLNMSLH
jgi:hypothetical protein